MDALFTNMINIVDAYSSIVLKRKCFRIIPYREVAMMEQSHFTWSTLPSFTFPQKEEHINGQFRC